jgi:rhamnopyranosyl-N-acetylglucosaminyl-diphospho-decaprenol beta-1,3/1,4-galactofuranosyltransferase
MNLDGKIKVAAVVVTYDKFDYLTKNINALLTQSVDLHEIYVVNNGDMDHIDTYIKNMSSKHHNIKYIRTGYNMGGAGGFHEGLKAASQGANKWFWLMDDDCLPEKHCLKKLLLHLCDKSYAYEPLVYDINDKKTILYDKNKKPNSGIIEVKIHTFNGFLVSKEIVEKIGLPEKDFFIYWDDIEYCLRINEAGGKVFLNTYATMYHPNKVRERKFKLFIVKDYDFNKLHVYYATRNQIILNNKYGGFKLEVSEIVRRTILYFITLRFDLLILYIKGIIHGRKEFYC